MKLYWVKIAHDEHGWYEFFEATLSDALAHTPDADSERRSKIVTFEIADLPRRDLILALLRRSEFTKRSETTVIREWGGKRWIKPEKGA